MSSAEDNAAALGREIRQFERNCINRLKQLPRVKKQRNRDGVETLKMDDWEDSMFLKHYLLLDR